MLLRWCGILLLLCCVGGLFAGCAGLKKAETLPTANNVPPSIELETVPFYPQERYQCGPAALAMALSWSGLPIRPEFLTDEVYTPALEGSLQTALISAARRHGRIAYVSDAMDVMFSEVAAGHPMIVLQNIGLSWYPIWHYAVVVGYDLQKEMVILRSGVTARKLMPFHIFEKTWARSNYWGLIILRPAELPAVAKEEPFLAAVLGLERSRQWRAAIAGYQTALTRWPGNLAALMGLGNSYYALGELRSSEEVLRQTVCLHPEAGSAFNNLAQILSDQGRRPEALEAARKAVSLGGPLCHIYQKTLEEIQSMTPHEKIR